MRVAGRYVLLAGQETGKCCSGVRAISLSMSQVIAPTKHDMYKDDLTTGFFGQSRIQA